MKKHPEKGGRTHEDYWPRPAAPAPPVPPDTKPSAELGVPELEWHHHGLKDAMYVLFGAAYCEVGSDGSWTIAPPVQSGFREVSGQCETADAAKKEIWLRLHTLPKSLWP